MSIDHPTKTESSPCNSKILASTSTILATAVSLVQEYPKAEIATKAFSHSLNGLKAKQNISLQSELMPITTTSASGRSFITTDIQSQSTMTISATATESISSTFNSTIVGTAPSDNTSSPTSLILSIVLPILLILLLLLACCVYQRKKAANFNEVIVKTASPSAYPIIPSTSLESIAIPMGAKKSFSTIEDFFVNLQDDDSFEYTKEPLPRKALPPPVLERNSSRNSIYALYDDASTPISIAKDLLISDAILAELAISQNSTSSYKSVCEKRMYDFHDSFFDEVHCASLVPSTDYTNSLVSIENDIHVDPDDSSDLKAAIETSSIVIPNEAELNHTSNDEQKKKAFAIELEETARGKFELRKQLPKWMSTPQFVNPSNNIDFSYSLAGKYNELEEDYDLDDYVTPAPTSHVAIMTYIPKRSEEMNLQNGDLIGIERQLSGVWCLGQNISQQRKRGLFPLYAVTPIRSGPSQAVRRGRFGGI